MPTDPKPTQISASSGEGSAGHAASLSRGLFFCDSNFKVCEGGGTEAISESPKYIYACEIRAMCPREIARSRLQQQQTLLLNVSCRHLGFFNGSILQSEQGSIIPRHSRLRSTATVGHKCLPCTLEPTSFGSLQGGLSSMITRHSRPRSTGIC